ncbi:MAG: hypothetical protein J0M08_04575 [Bacteroidetes bacterium]|nr:hypothetical protein [Bacteroidota bacterium]
MKILLDIKDSKAAFFMEVLKNFSFVKAKPISEEESLFVEELKEAVHNVNLAKKGKLKAKPLKDLLREL